MTNAPFILNVDCDMFANNPEVILHGMCLLLGFDDEVASGYVQAPQRFYAALKDDPFGNQLVFINKVCMKLLSLSLSSSLLLFYQMRICWRCSAIYISCRGISLSQATIFMWFQKLGTGIAGIQGPFYGGTGCFHRRKIIYGASPGSGETDGHARLNGTLIKQINIYIY